VIVTRVHISCFAIIYSEWRAITWLYTLDNKQKILRIEKWWKKNKVIEKTLLSTSAGPVMKIDVHYEVSYHQSLVIPIIEHHSVGVQNSNKRIQSCCCFYCWSKVLHLIAISYYHLWVNYNSYIAISYYQLLATCSMVD
jgi:hypothetical protein